MLRRRQRSFIGHRQLALHSNIIIKTISGGLTDILFLLLWALPSCFVLRSQSQSWAHYSSVDSHCEFFHVMYPLTLFMQRERVVFIIIWIKKAVKGGSRRSDTDDRRINPSQRTEVGQNPPFSSSEGSEMKRRGRDGELGLGSPLRLSVSPSVSCVRQALTLCSVDFFIYFRDV